MGSSAKGRGTRFIFALVVMLSGRLWAESITVSWNRNTEPDLAGYKVYYGTSSGHHSEVIDVGLVTRWVVDGLQPTTKYYFVVTAYDSSGNESEPSEEVSAVTLDRTPPALVAVTVRSATEALVTFSEPVEPNSAQNPANYRIDGGVMVTQALLTTDPRIVLLRTSAHTNGRAYTLAVSNVADLATPPNVIPSNSTIQYRCEYQDVTPPQLVSATLVDPTTLRVQFSEPVDRAIAENVSNYAINNGIQISVATLNAMGDIVTLSTSPHRAGVVYVLTVNNIIDRAPTPNFIAPNSTVFYTYDPGDTQGPRIVTVTLPEATQVVVQFDEPLEPASAQLAGNYAITGGIVVFNASLDSTGCVVRLTTSSHVPGVPYVLTVNNVRDRAPQANLISPNTAFGYLYDPGDIDPPTLIAASLLDPTHLLITFSEPVQQVSAEMPFNYTINNGIGVRSATLLPDGRTVRLETSPHGTSATYIVTVNNVADRASRPNFIAANSSITYVYAPQDLTGPTIRMVTVHSTTEIEVSFSEQVDSVSAEDPANYSISNGITVLAARRTSSGYGVRLTTTEHATNQIYILLVSNVTDTADPPNAILPNSPYSYLIRALDEVPPTIVSVTIQNQTTLDILFSEEVERVSAEQASNYVISNGVQVRSAHLDNSGRVVRLTTSAHEFGMVYILLVSNVADCATPANMILPHSAYAYALSPGDQTPPTIASVRTLSATTLEVTFSKPVDPTSAQDASHYRINNAVQVQSAVLDSSGQVVRLETTMHQPERVHVLLVSDIYDRAVPPNVIAPNSSFTYVYHAPDETPPTIVLVRATGLTEVEVLFSEPVARREAENPVHYVINNGLQVLAAELDASAQVVRLSTTPHTPNRLYVLVVNGIADVALPPNVLAPNTSYSYTYEPPPVLAPTVSSARLVDSQTLEVTFNKPVEQATAEDPANYSISNGITVFSASLGGLGNVVRLYTSPHVPNTLYILLINGIRDCELIPTTIAPNTPCVYTYQPEDQEAPYIVAVRVVEASRLDVEFSEEVDRSSAETTGNYTINNGVQVLGAVLATDGRVVHLTTSPHVPDRIYVLLVRGVVDTAPFPNGVAPNTAYTYIYSPPDRTGPTIRLVTVRSATEVDVLFSEPVERNGAETSSNYAISHGVQVIASHLDSSGTRVTLSTTPHTPRVVHILMVSNITDLSPAHNVIVANSPYSYVFTPADQTEPTIVMVTPIDQSHLDVHFSEAVERSSAEDESNYQISGLAVQEATLDASAVIVRLTITPCVPGQVYVLLVSNVKDRATPPNTIRQNSPYAFTFRPADTTPPTIAAVRVLDATSVEVTYSKPVDRVSATQTANYVISNGVRVLTASLDHSHLLVRLTTSTHEPDLVHLLMVSNVTDTCHPANVILPNSSYAYVYQQADRTAPTVVMASLRDASHLAVVFSEAVDELTAVQTENYRLNNGTRVLSAILENTTTVLLSTTPHEPGKIYILMVSGVADRAPVPNVIASNTPYSYVFTPADLTAPVITAVNAVDETHVEVSFSKQLELSSAETADNYRISGGVEVRSAKLDPAGTMVLLSTSAHTPGKLYILTVSNVRDRASIPNQIAPNSPYLYTYDPLERTTLAVSNVEVMEETLLRVTFTTQVDPLTAADPRNYGINNGIVVVRAEPSPDGLSVFLVTTPHTNGGTYTLTVSNIKNRAAVPQTIRPLSTFTYSYIPELRVVILSTNECEKSFIAVGKEYYVDRHYFITSFPEGMEGALMLKMANGDKGRAESEFLRFEVDRDVVVSVAYDSRATTFPSWLTKRFARTNQFIGVTDGAKRLDLWVQRFKKGVIALGANMAAGAVEPRSMYLVVVQTDGASGRETGGDGHNTEGAQPYGTGGVPRQYSLQQNFPNPFNPDTEIRYQLPRAAKVKMTVYNILGRRVKTLFEGEREPGYYRAYWNAVDDDGFPVATGLYLCRIECRTEKERNGVTVEVVDYAATIKLMYMK